MKRIPRWMLLLAVVAACASAWVRPSYAKFGPDDPESKDLLELEKEWQVGPYAPAPGTHGRTTRPAAIPDIFGPGAVLSVGNLWMKITNDGFDGNPFTNISSDPSGQWPGASSVEYLNFLGMLVGAVNPIASDPTAVRRVSYATEWRPPTLDPEDRIYRSYDGIVNGQRYVNDDSDKDPLTGDPRVDEDFLDGRDNDGDGLIDEDYAAIGQQMYSCVMRDDTPQAINAAFAERHVPLGLECRKSAWAYSIPGYTDFNVIQYDIYNRSGHTLDSVVIGWLVDLDCGPIEKGNYFSDDFDLPDYPHGDFWVQTKQTDLRLQPPGDRGANVPGADPDSGLCERFKIRVQGFSVADDDGDDGRTTGIPSFMLVDHTVDPTGINGPPKVAFRAFRSFVGGTPYGQGGAPRIDQQRFEFMTSQENISPETGWITSVRGDQKGDYAGIASVGPWRNFADGAHLTATVALGVRTGKYRDKLRYTNDYNLAASPSGIVGDATALMTKYESLDNAIAMQIAFEGAYEVRSWVPLPDYYGRETCIKAPPGQFLTLQGCVDRDQVPRLVTDRKYECFDFDCDYCTGAFSKSRGGLFHRNWLAEAPPPSPNNNLAVGYNYSDNPDRHFQPAGDRQVTLAWDNLSETTPDPKSGQFDFRGYKIWKVSNWTRPVGSGGPSEEDWTLLAEYRMFDQKYTNGHVCPPESAAVCTPGDTVGPWVFIPTTDLFKRVLLFRGDLWNRQTGDIIRPEPTVLCSGWPDCLFELGLPLGQDLPPRIPHIKYPVGRYHYIDRDVKNGFLYFYSVTGFDSTGSGDQIAELSSRRSAVEAEGVVPQAAADTVHGGKNVWVVPNPYRGNKQIKDRPSSWDLTPNASDPTGTHVDFMGLPRGDWKIRVFTVSGDLVAELNARDGVNESIRGSVTDSHGDSHPGVNRQADGSNDGEARWNLISRNGQDVVSGVYLFTVELGGNVKHRGKFIIIR